MWLTMMRAVGKLWRENVVGPEPPSVHIDSWCRVQNRRARIHCGLDALIVGKRQQGLRGILDVIRPRNRIVVEWVKTKGPSQ